MSARDFKSRLPKFLCNIIHRIREYTDWTVQHRNFDEDFLREYSEGIIGAITIANADIEAR